jgi:hypothetical protein
VGLRVEARWPRLQVLAAGAVLPGVIEAEVSSNNHLAADRFRFRVAAASGGLVLVDAPGVRLDVQVAVNGAWASLVQGEADCVVLDPLRGVVEVEGRDLSALLIDSRVDETFANQTSSEIAAALAGRHGLGAAASPTQTLVGRYYQSEHDRTTMGQFSRAMSEWDLLSYLAVQEGFDLFMDGDVLRFEPRAPGEPVTVTPDDCESLHLEHSLGMERAIEVTVRSWDQRGGQAVVQTAQGGGGGRAWRHAVVRPNLPPDEAQRLADRVLADLMRHVRTASLTMPGDLVVSPRSAVALQGTGTGWDGIYMVSEVSRRIDVRRGFSQRVCLQGAG